MFKFKTFARFNGRAVVIINWVNMGYVMVRAIDSEFWFSVQDAQLTEF
jgi:hypothetical protein